MRKSYLIPRRTFLRGCGATMLALPTLDIMAANKVEKQPLRMALLYKGCGVNPSSWDIHGATEDNYELSKILKPLEENKKDIVILSGIDSNQRANGGHPNAVTAFMTGKTKNKRFQQYYTFDQIIADKIKHKTPIKSLVLRSDHYIDPNDPCENYLSYDKAGNPLEVEANPEFLFNKLFKGFNNKSYRQKTASILDDIKDSFNSVNRQASKQDREVLQQYLSSVRDVEKNIEQFKKQTADGRRAERLKQLPDLSGTANDIPGRTKAMLDLIALAFWTDMTSVASLIMAHTESRSIYDFLGINDELHYMSHFVRNRKVIPGYDKVNEWYTGQFNYFINKLKSLKDGNQTVFDNSLILYGSEMKHGDYHSVSDLPLVLSGGAGGQLKLGRYVKYTSENNCNLLLKMIQMMGVNEKQYGVSTAPLNGITERSNFKPHYVDDGSWKIIKKEGKKIEVKGMLRVEVTEANPNLYVLQLSNKQRIEIKTAFMNIHKTKMDTHTGTVINLKGEFKMEKGKIVINKVDSCKRL